MTERRDMIHPEAGPYAERVLALSALARQRCRLVGDVAYGADPRQALDIFLPDQDPAAPCPVFVFFHGGAWRAGDKAWMGFLAPLFVDLPAIYVSAGYRLSPEHRFPAHLDDVLDALAWVVANIGAHGGDPDRVFVGGHSAGGHLAALAAARPDLRAQRGIPDGAVRGCLPVSAAFDFRAPPGQRDRTQEIIYAEVLADAGQDVDASPIAWVDRIDMPFFITYGDADFPRIRDQGAAMAEALSRRGAPVSWLVLPGAGHFDTNQDCTDTTHPWVAEARRLIAGGPPRSGAIRPQIALQREA